MTTHKQRQFKRDLVRSLPSFIGALVLVAMLGLALVTFNTI